MTFFIREIKDTYVQENFKQLDGILADDILAKGKFKFFQIDVSGAVTNQPRMHFLGFSPKDIIQTSSIGTGLLTWNYANFTSESIYFTTTGPVIVRAFIGRYEES